MSHARINAAAVRIKTANDHVIDADQRGQHAHRRDQPKRRVTRDRKCETDDIGLARAPVAVQNGRRAFPIDIARTFNVGWYQLINSTQNEAHSRDEALHFAESDLRHPLPFNDADEVSCRARATKCSRCRASFAPIPPAVAVWKLGSPLIRSSRIIKRNKELPERSDGQTTTSNRRAAGRDTTL